MRLRPPTGPTLTPQVASQLSDALTEAGWADPTWAITRPFRLTTRWGWISGPSHDLEYGGNYPVEIHLHKPTNVLSDAAKADRDHMSKVRYAAGSLIVVPVLIALAWLIYGPVLPIAGVVVGAGAGWAMWKWVLPRVTVPPIGKAPMTVVEARPTPAAIIAAVRSVPFVQVLDDLGASLPDAGDSHEQYVNEWKTQWQTHVEGPDEA